jgi:hypothetical protein
LPNAFSEWETKALKDQETVGKEVYVEVRKAEEKMCDGR